MAPRQPYDPPSSLDSLFESQRWAPTSAPTPTHIGTNAEPNENAAEYYLLTPRLGGFSIRAFSTSTYGMVHGAREIAVDDAPLGCISRASSRVILIDRHAVANAPTIREHVAREKTDERT